MEKEKSFRQGKEIQRKRKRGGPAWVPEAPVPSPLLASTRWRNGSTFLERHYSSSVRKLRAGVLGCLWEDNPQAVRGGCLSADAVVSPAGREGTSQRTPQPPTLPLYPGSYAWREGSAPSG